MKDKENIAEALRHKQLAMLGEMFSEVVHEVRNLMQTITGLTELEINSSTSASSKSRLQQIRHYSQLVGQLTTNLLRFSSADSSKALCDINRCVTDMLRLISLRSHMNVRIISELSPYNPMGAIPEEYLQLVLINLLKNALEAVDGLSPAEIKATVCNTGDRAIVKIWNSGPPIPSTALFEIFNRFYSTKQSAAGTGLGLSVAQRLVEQFGGTIHAENIESGGVCFEINLPLASSTITEKTVDFEEPARVHLNLQGARVLIIDDDGSIQDILKLMVTEMGGGSADACSTSREALSLINAKSYDAIFLDILLKSESGDVVYERLPPNCKARVIFITGDVGRSNVIQSTSQPVLLKPVNFESIVAAVNRVRSSST